MAETVGVLKLRIDAEAGAALEALAQLERERDEAREWACRLYGDLGEVDYYGRYTKAAMEAPEWLVDKT